MTHFDNAFFPKFAIIKAGIWVAALCSCCFCSMCVSHQREKKRTKK